MIETFFSYDFATKCMQNQSLLKKADLESGVMETKRYFSEWEIYRNIYDNRRMSNIYLQKLKSIKFENRKGQN